MARTDHDHDDIGGMGATPGPGDRRSSLSPMSPVNPTPPTEPGDLMLDEPAAWPKVVGIISIIWTGLSLTCIGCGLLSPLAVNFIPEDQRAGGLPPSMQPGPIFYALYALGLVLSGVLLAAGITLLSRKPVARGLHLVWGVASFISGLASVAYSWHLQQLTVEWAKQNPQSPFAQTGPGQEIGAIVGLAVGLFLGLAYPLFCLIWFGLVKTDSKEITRGTRPVI